MVSRSMVLREYLLIPASLALFTAACSQKPAEPVGYRLFVTDEHSGDMTIISNRVTGHWRAHGKYIVRESAVTCATPSKVNRISNEEST
jgi:hypothetical protein